MKHPSVLLLAACAAVRCLAAASAVSESKLAEACAVLQRQPLAPAERQVLSEVSRQADYNPALRSRAMAAYSLTLLMQGDTNAFERAVQALRAAYPEMPPLITVTREAAFAPCETCLGKGAQMIICPDCRGLGKCKSCDATGRKDGAACPVCKGKGACARCGGKKRIETACPACRGSRVFFKPGESIRNNYNAVLAEIVALVEENARYAEQFRAASREADTAKRIALLTALINAYPHRTDLGPAKLLLADAVNARKSQEAAQRQREEREREAREIEALRALANATDLRAAIATLNAYLQAHPKTSAYTELKTLMDELIAKRNRQARLRKITYGVIAGAIFLFLAACLRPLLARPKTAHIGPLPGMDKIDKSKFTDPLALTSEESRHRARSETDEPSPPGG